MCQTSREKGYHVQVCRWLLLLSKLCCSSANRAHPALPNAPQGNCWDTERPSLTFYRWPGLVLRAGHPEVLLGPWLYETDWCDRRRNETRGSAAARRDIAWRSICISVGGMDH